MRHRRASSVRSRFMFVAVTATAAAAAGGLATHPVEAQDAGGAGASATRTQPTFTLDTVERAAGWEVLFDGTSSEAFRTFRSPDLIEGPWRIDADGCLVTSGGGGDIITRRQFGNFELVLEWAAGPGGNSGIMYRVTEEQSATYLTGPEYQILDDAGYGDGVAADANFSAGALYALATPPADKVLRPAGEFNEARIRLMNGWVTHWLNGVKVAEMNLDGAEFDAAVAASKFADMPGFGKAKVGHIALQAHGDPIRFRNIRVRDFDGAGWATSDLLRGENGTPSLDRWTYHLNAPAEMSDVWTLEDGVLQCAGRPIGYIRTKDDYQNYVLQLEWRFDPERGAGNSGVLVRMVGEDTVWPTSVEAQLQSGRAGDFWNIGEFAMSVPADRTNGRNTRHLYANERPLGAWNHYEIIVHRGDVRLRVNGEELNVATDVAEVAGKICLQSEGAYIEYRNIRLRPIIIRW